ncbi:hypothetical protein CPB83DRAFT_564615 [Crepidotus variabilis]|uniref:Uncharacterized protein n=1 Tax=Crepidotus variabilis TaxID=179855 RepID=A0A9P6EA94_9AGAR|nr:hypothetical protein CPB83DRAFT_564615 [Crepidotus variabilis]
MFKPTPESIRRTLPPSPRPATTASSTNNYLTSVTLDVAIHSWKGRSSGSPLKDGGTNNPQCLESNTSNLKFQPSVECQNQKEKPKQGLQGIQETEKQKNRKSARIVAISLRNIRRGTRNKDQPFGGHFYQRQSLLLGKIAIGRRDCASWATTYMLAELTLICYSSMAQL